MKYSTIFFDWGDTLSNNAGKEGPEGWVAEMLARLYNHSYRLGIISNTSRYQDAHWIRRSLEHMKCARYIECVISSALYGYHKPDVKIYQKAVEFMEINPTRAVMVGDSQHCDGGAQVLGMNYLYVVPNERWDAKLYDLLGDRFPKNRKLSRISEYGLIGDNLFVKMSHLSEPIVAGDSILLDQEEYVILEASDTFTKEDVLNPEPKHKFVEFKVRPIASAHSPTLL